MKKTNIMKSLSSLTILALSASLAHSATILSVSGSGGMIDGTSTTYTVGTGTTADEGGDGISFSNATAGSPITITFTAAVDLVISPTASNASFVFDTIGSFTTIGGVLNYSVGSFDVEDQSTGAPYATFSGNGTNVLSWTAVDGSNLDKATSNDDWGSITANGITSISFVNTSFKDTYKFTATAVPVPEPSAALLGCVGLLSLLRRRR